MEKLHSLPKLLLDSEEARAVQQQYDHLIVEMDQFEKATVEVCRHQLCAKSTILLRRSCILIASCFSTGKALLAVCSMSLTAVEPSDMLLLLHSFVAEAECKFVWGRKTSTICYCRTGAISFLLFLTRSSSSLLCHKTLRALF